jgi:NADH-quinone oxidoreductase subunit J
VSVEQILFYLLAAGALCTAVMMVLHRNPVMSAIFLIGNFFCIAALYLLLQAQFLAVIQVVIYTGAIMVLVLFVIMLLNLGDEEKLAERFSKRAVVGSVLVVGLALELVVLLGFGPPQPPVAPEQAGTVGLISTIGDALFGRFLLPFEITSVLLLAAIVGAVILAKKRL